MNLIVEGIEIEMPDVPITQTLQVNDYFDVKDRRVSYTSEFTIPDTAHNTAIFQLAGAIGSTSIVPYRLLDCELIHNGVEITNKAKLRIKSRDSKGYKCSIQDGNATFYELIEGRKLSDLDFTEINHILNPTTYVESLYGYWPDGYIYGIGYWGKPFTDIEYDYQIPCLYKRYVLNKIFEAAGIATGSVYNEIFDAPLDEGAFCEADTWFFNTTEGNTYTITTESGNSFLRCEQVSPGGFFWRYTMSTVVGVEYTVDLSVLANSLVGESFLNIRDCDTTTVLDSHTISVSATGDITMSFTAIGETTYIHWLHPSFGGVIDFDNFIVQSLGSGYDGDFSSINEHVISPNVPFNNETDVIPPVLVVETDYTYSEFLEANSDTTYELQYSFENVISNPETMLVGNEILITEPGFYNLNLDGSLNLSTNGDWLEMTIKRNGNTIRSWYLDQPSTGLAATEDNYFYANSGDIITVHFRVNTSAVTVLGETTWRASFSAGLNPKLYRDNNALAVNFNALFDMGQPEFIKDIMQQLGMLFQYKRDGIYYFKRIEDIINGDAVDWSTKFISSESVEFSIGSFTQKNRMAYKYPDEVDPWGDAFITIDDEKLSKDESTLFQSPYQIAVKSDKVINGVKLSDTTYWEEDDTEFEPVEQGSHTYRVIRVEGDIDVTNSGGGGSLTYSGTFGYLDSFPMRMSNFLVNNYPQYNGIVNRPEVRKIKMDLNAFDVHNVDFLTKYYCEDLGYFLLNSIKYDGGVSECEVIMLR